MPQCACFTYCGAREPFPRKELHVTSEIYIMYKDLPSARRDSDIRIMVDWTDQVQYYTSVYIASIELAVKTKEENCIEKGTPCGNHKIGRIQMMISENMFSEYQKNRAVRQQELLTDRTHELKGGAVKRSDPIHTAQSTVVEDEKKRMMAVAPQAKEETIVAAQNTNLIHPSNSVQKQNAWHAKFVTGRFSIRALWIGILLLFMRQIAHTSVQIAIRPFQ